MADCIYNYCTEKATVLTLGVAQHCKIHHKIAIEELASEYLHDLGRTKSVKTKTIIKYLELVKGNISVRIIADRFRISWPTADKYLCELESCGVLKPIGNGSYVKV